MNRTYTHKTKGWIASKLEHRENMYIIKKEGVSSLIGEESLISNPNWEEHPPQ